MEKALFAAARELSDPGERQAFLNQNCMGNAALRQRLEELLAAESQANQFFAQGTIPLPPPLAIQDAPVTEKAGERIGRYKLLEKLGEGGCGVVYVAEQEEPVRRRVALKIIKLGMDTRGVVARFEAERQALAMMDHPNIAKVLDAGATETGRPYFIMELVRGIKLTDYCDQNKLTTRARLDLFIQICQAVQHAHQKGIIHRDLKPSNILVTLHDGIPVPKVIDFGIAKATEGRLTDLTVYTELHQFIGTPAYMSPEQAEMSGLDVDTRSDIYSLGVVLYELLTGCTPFDAKDLLASGLEAMRRTICEQDPVRPSNRLHTLSGAELTTRAQRRGVEAPKLISLLRGDLDWIVMKCLEKDRTRRYETANGLAADLRRFVTDEPVLARPPSACYRLRKMVRRNRGATLAVSGVAVSLVIGSATATWQAIRASRAERAQTRLRAQAERAAAQETTFRQAAESARAEEAAQRQRAEAGEKAAQRLLYAAKMNLAQLAWDQHNFGTARQALDDAASSVEHGFEWHYWQRLAHAELHILQGHLAPVWSVAFSPDGQRVVTGSWDKTAKVWDVSSGAEVLALKGHPDSLVKAGFSPDAQKIFTVSSDGSIKVWDATSGAELLTWRDSERILTAAVAPDGRRLATGNRRSGIKLWELASGKELQRFTFVGDEAFSLSFTRNGDQIGVAGGDGHFRMLDAATGHELLTWPGTRAWWTLDFSPDGERVVGNARQAPCVWDVTTGRELFRLEGHASSVIWSGFSPNGERVATGSQDQTARIWDAKTGRPLLTLKGHREALTTAAFSPDGRLLVTGSWDSTARVWDLQNQPGPVTFEENGQTTALSLSRDGRRMVSGHLGGTLKVWDLEQKREILKLLVAPGADEFWAAACSPDGRRVAAGCSNTLARIWDGQTGRTLLTLAGHRGSVRSIVFSADGSRVATGGTDHAARVWDSATGKELATCKGHSRTIHSVTFSADGKRLGTASTDGTARLWDAATGQELLKIQNPDGGVMSVAFSPDNKRFATGNSADGIARVWDVTNGQLLTVLKGHSDKVYGIAFSPDGSRVLTSSSYGSAILWDSASGQAVLTLKAHAADILALAMSHDGRRIATGGSDGKIKIWDAATDEQEAAWEAHEKAGKEHLAALQQNVDEEAKSDRARRLQDPGAIKEWLLLGPIPISRAERTNMVNRHWAAPLDLFQAKRGKRVTVGSQELVWRPKQVEDGRLNLNDFYEGQTASSVVYAVCYLESAEHRTGLRLRGASSDRANVILNGVSVLQTRGAGQFTDDLVEEVVENVSLRPGWNTLLFAMPNNGDTHHEGWVWISRADGQPIPGLRVSLAPEQP